MSGNDVTRRVPRTCPLCGHHLVDDGRCLTCKASDSSDVPPTKPWKMRLLGSALIVWGLVGFVLGFEGEMLFGSVIALFFGILFFVTGKREPSEWNL